MSRTVWFRIVAALLIALGALLLIRLHNAAGTPLAFYSLFPT